MEYRKFGSKYFVRMDPGEEILTSLKALCIETGIGLAQVNALGALNFFTVGLYNTETKQYASRDFSIPVEITSLWGTVTTEQGSPYLHLHLSAADEQGLVYGGHLSRAVVSATCEMVVDAADGTVERAFSEEIGLNLFRFV